MLLLPGRIAELGTHDELLARNRYYTSLFEKQHLEEELSVATWPSIHFILQAQSNHLQKVISCPV